MRGIRGRLMVLAIIAIVPLVLSRIYDEQGDRALLPGADFDGAVKVAERARAAVDNLGIAHVASPIGHVTVSIGVASAHPRPDISPQTLIEAADANLYEAKNRGRNIVVSRMIRLAATG